jgi:hypothetical protein
MLNGVGLFGELRLGDDDFPVAEFTGDQDYEQSDYEGGCCHGDDYFLCEEKTAVVYLCLSVNEF